MIPTQAAAGASGRQGLLLRVVRMVDWLAPENSGRVAGPATSQSNDYLHTSCLQGAAAILLLF